MPKVLAGSCAVNRQKYIAVDDDGLKTGRIRSGIILAASSTRGCFTHDRASPGQGRPVWVPETDGAPRTAVARIEKFAGVWHVQGAPSCVLIPIFFECGDLPTLFAAFLYFDVSFMVWVLLGPLGVQIGEALQLNPAQKGLMVATPVLAGALLRIERAPGDRIGASAPRSALSWLSSPDSSLPGGSACRASMRRSHSASCSAWPGPPSRSRYRSPRAGIRRTPRNRARHCRGRQLGHGARGSLRPRARPRLRLYERVRPRCAHSRAGLRCVHDSRQGQPGPPAAADNRRLSPLLGIRDTWWFMLFYSVTFGGFVGLAASLTIYFHDAVRPRTGRRRLCDCGVSSSSAPRCGRSAASLPIGWAASVRSRSSISSPPRCSRW